MEIKGGAAWKIFYRKIKYETLHNWKWKPDINWHTNGKNSLPSLLYTVAFISASPRQIFTARHWFILRINTFSDIGEVTERLENEQSSMCSGQGQVHHYMHSNQGYSSADGRSATANSWTKAAVLPGWIDAGSFQLLSTIKKKEYFIKLKNAINIFST